MRRRYRFYDGEFQTRGCQVDSLSQCLRSPASVKLTRNLPGGSIAEFWRSRPGCLDVEVVANLDAPDLWALVSRWRDVGSYRRALSGNEAKLLLTPILIRAIDEPSAYLDPQELHL